MVKQINNSLSIKTNSIWNLLGSLCYALSQWGMIIVIAKFGSPVMVGVFTMGLAITGPIMLLTNLNLSAAIATDTRDEYKFSDYYGLRILSIIIFIMTVSMVLIFGGFNKEASLVIIALCFAKAFESLSDLMFGIMQKNERMDKIALSRIMKSVLSLTTLVVLMYITGELYIASFGLALSWLFIFIIYDLKNAGTFTDTRPEFEIHIIYSIIKITIPLGIAQLLASLVTNMPRYLIDYHLGIEMVGYFTALAYIVIAGNTVVSAIGQATVPRLAKYYITSLSAFIKLQLTLFIIGLGISTMAILIIRFFGSEILTIMYDSSYAEYGNTFFLLIVSGSLIYLTIFVEFGLIATRKFFIQPYLNIITLVVVSVGSGTLIPIYGLDGGAYALILSSSIRLILSVTSLYYFIKKIHKVEKDLSKDAVSNSDY